MLHGPLKKTTVVHQWAMVHRLKTNVLEDTLIREYSSTFEIAKLGQNILRHSVGEKRKKIHVSSNRERIGVYCILQEQRPKRRDYYLIIKLRITFNGDKLHRHD